MAIPILTVFSSWQQPSLPRIRSNISPSIEIVPCIKITREARVLLGKAFRGHMVNSSLSVPPHSCSNSMILLFIHHNLKYCAIHFMQGLPSKSADKPNKPKLRVIIITPEKSLLIIPKTQGDATFNHSEACNWNRLFLQCS